MRPIKFAGAEVVYRGPTPEIGDLWCQRERPGVIRSVWTFTDEERQAIAEGASLSLTLMNEPIPPIAMFVTDEQPVGDHEWKVDPAEVPE